MADNLEKTNLGYNGDVVQGEVPEGGIISGITSQGKDLDYGNTTGSVSPATEQGANWQQPGRGKGFMADSGLHSGTGDTPIGDPSG